MDYNPFLCTKFVIASFRFSFICFVCFSVGYRTKRNCNFVLVAISGYRKGDLKKDLEILGEGGGGNG